MSQRPWFVRELSAGMVLAEDLNDVHGTRLLNAGTVLNERTIALLQERAVEKVVVDLTSKNGDEEAGDLAARRRTIEAEVDLRFSRVRGQPIMESLRAAVIAHRLRRGGLDA